MSKIVGIDLGTTDSAVAVKEGGDPRRLAWNSVLIGLFIACVVLVTLFGAVQAAMAAGVLYAAPSASGSGDCSDWDNACTLQTALTT